MSIPFKLARITSLKTVAGFRSHIASLGLNLPCEEKVTSGQKVPNSEISILCSDHLRQAKGQPYLTFFGCVPG